MGLNKKWLSEEVDYLEDNWGKCSVKTLAKNLQRSENAIKLKAQKLKLGNPLDYFDGFTVHSLAKIIHVDYKRIMNWIERYDFPAKLKSVGSQKKVLVVKQIDFMKWLQENKQMVDFSKIEPRTFGNEPQWMSDKRNADSMKAHKIKKSNETHWSKEEDNILKGMLSAFCFTYSEIAARIQRSEGAIKRRIGTLGLKARPVRSSVTYPEDPALSSTYNKREWSEKDISTLMGMIKNYQYTIVEVAIALNRTVSSIKAMLREQTIAAELKEYHPPKSKETGRFLKDPMYELLPAAQSYQKWSDKEKQLAIKMCEQQCTIVDISKALNRTLGSVKNQIRKLGVKPRPLDEYTSKQVEFIVSMIEKGYCMEDIGQRIGKSANGIRGKLERMGYKFKNGVPIQPEKQFIEVINIPLEKYIK